MITRMHALALCLILFVAVPAFASDAPANDVTVVLDTTVTSSYLWRGWEINGSPSLQPSVTLGWRDFTFSTWHNFSRDVPAHQAWTEHDLSFAYAPTVRRWTFTFGLAAFLFPDKTVLEGNRTVEASFGITHNSWLQPSFTVYHD